MLHLQSQTDAVVQATPNAFLKSVLQVNVPQTVLGLNVMSVQPNQMDAVAQPTHNAFLKSVPQVNVRLIVLVQSVMSVQPNQMDAVAQPIRNAFLESVLQENVRLPEQVLQLLNLLNLLPKQTLDAAILHNLEENKLIVKHRVVQQTAQVEGVQQEVLLIFSIVISKKLYAKKTTKT
ncbi:MAG: hypothetical protein H0W89_02385 [Candidatus Levybacteria bacterium]|nr:hypothetical protein [Candidatus Levybacteria bacterium]